MLFQTYATLDQMMAVVLIEQVDFGTKEPVTGTPVFLREILAAKRQQRRE